MKVRCYLELEKRSNQPWPKIFPIIRVIGYTIAPFNFEQISVFSVTRWNRVYPSSYPGHSRFNNEYASVEFLVCEG